MNKQSGISPILIVIILLVVAGGGWAVYTAVSQDDGSPAPEEQIPADTDTPSADEANDEAPVTETPPVPAETPASPPPSGGSTETPSPAVKEFNITGQSFFFSPREIRVKLGDKIKINFTSAGDFHDWTLDGYSVGTAQVNTGQSASVEFTADKAGGFEYYCSVGTHRAMGMVGAFIVE